MSQAFLEYVTRWRPVIAAAIQSFIDQHAHLLRSVAPHPDHLIPLLADYASRGKMLRGVLAILGTNLFSDRIPESSKSLALSLELLQSGLLVHDDIMDHDSLRRGMPTFHIQLENMLSADGTPTSFLHRNVRASLAEAQGICAGDAYFFLSWKALSSTPPDVAALVAEEHLRVAAAQMNDVELGSIAAIPNLDQVLSMYRYKTARYSVALPLVAGSMLSHIAPREAIPFLETFGEALGVIFQIQDDWIGLFGNEKESGKPTGSDLKEGKKTPYIIKLWSKLSPSDRERLGSILGNRSLAIEDIEWVRSSILSYGIEQSISSITQELLAQASEALDKIDSFSPNAEAAAALKSFMIYSTSRKG
ncbi:MAG: polyprenyl synthetase family protein [Spirochaetaceae bacterium]|nr:polyprenyl synthetase family protein [Spirochaetaceae bacterium]